MDVVDLGFPLGARVLGDGGHANLDLAYCGFRFVQGTLDRAVCAVPQTAGRVPSTSFIVRDVEGVSVQTVGRVRCSRLWTAVRTPRCAINYSVNYMCLCVYKNMWRSFLLSLSLHTRAG